MRLSAFISTVTLATLTAFAADTAPSTAPTPGPKNDTGLTATLILTKDSYPLDPAQSGKTFRDSLNASKNARGMGVAGSRLPAPPAIDATLRITNTTDQPITLTTGGDDSQITLKLEGPGAVTVENPVPMTMEFHIGKPTTLAPGKTLDLKITSLAFGMRGISQHAYWTEPGDYTLTATLAYGTPDNKQGQVTSAATKLKIEAPKP